MRSRLGWHGRLAFAGALVATLAVTAPAGAATTVEVDGGQTTLKVATATANRFQRLEVSIGVNPPARTRRFDSVFPIVGGRIDPATARGTLEHRGSLTILRGPDELTLKGLQIRVGKSSYVSAKVGGKRVNVFALSVRRVARDGFGTVVKPVKASVTRAAAKAVNGALGVRALSSGQAFGKVGVTVEPAQIALTGGSTTLAFNAATQATLGQLGVSVAPTAPASTDAAGALEFPVTGGVLDVETASGTIEHGGGISLTAAARRVDLTTPTVTFADTPQLGVTYSGAPIAIADLSVDGEPDVDPAARTITANITAARLTTTAATAINGFFPNTALRAGTDIGTATLTAQAR